MRLLTASIVSIFLFAQTSLAQSFNYVDPAIISPAFLDKPIQKDDPSLEAQVNEVVKLQQNATKKDLKEADAEAHMTPDLVLSTIEGLSNIKKFPKTNQLINKVDSDCHTISGQAKAYWNTERPFQVSDKIQALVEKPNNASYPSGHTTCSRVVAEVLGQVFPNKREILRERAAAIASHRIIAGVHWPQDIAGGKQLAMLILGALQQSAAYQADLKAAIAEQAK